LAGTSPDTSSSRCLPLCSSISFALFSVSKKIVLNSSDLVLRDAELVDQGVIEELHVRKVLAALVAVDRRDIRGLQDRLTQPDEFFLLVLRTEDFLG
jgi:hypothetical protein